MSSIQHPASSSQQPASRIQHPASRKKRGPKFLKKELQKLTKKELIDMIYRIAEKSGEQVAAAAAAMGPDYFDAVKQEYGAGDDYPVIIISKNPHIS